MAEPVYDPDYDERMSRRLRAPQAPVRSDYSDHYAEKAAAREAAQRAAQETRDEIQSKRRTQQEISVANAMNDFYANDRQPQESDFVDPESGQADYFRWNEARTAWDRRAESLRNKVQGRDLADKIMRRITPFR